MSISMFCFNYFTKFIKHSFPFSNLLLFLNIFR
nr:MAG TPA: hypothetical protein [Caudoviricetes sp.]